MKRSRARSSCDRSSYTNTWLLTAPPNAVKLRVHFTKIELERDDVHSDEPVGDHIRHHAPERGGFHQELARSCAAVWRRLLQAGERARLSPSPLVYHIHFFTFLLDLAVPPGPNR